MFLIVVHLHIFHGLYYASYSSPREFVRCLGVVIFLLMIVIAFIGYVLPWGQMSFWGATVITSLASTIPVVGDTSESFLTEVEMAVTLDEGKWNLEVGDRIELLFTQKWLSP